MPIHGGTDARALYGQRAVAHTCKRAQSIRGTGIEHIAHAAPVEVVEQHLPENLEARA
jgi:hypothetical protein